MSIFTHLKNVAASIDNGETTTTSRSDGLSYSVSKDSDGSWQATPNNKQSQAKLDRDAAILVDIAESL